MRSLSPALVLVLACAMPAAWADCNGTANSELSNCTTIQQQAEAFKAGMAKYETAQEAMQGISTSGFGLSSITNSAAQADQEVSAACRASKSKVTQACSSCTGTQKIQCQATEKKTNAQLETKAAQADASAANNDSGSSDSKNTGQQSQGGMPSMPQSGSGSDQGSGLSATPNTSGTASTTSASAPPTSTAGFSGGECASDNAYLYDKCSTALAQSCSGKFTGSSVCQNFSARYCQSPSGSSSSSQASAGAMAAGEGFGSSYCMAYQGGSFCNNNPGSESCPSCSHQAVPAGTKLPEVCNSDPAFSNPSFAQAAAGKTGASAGGSGSGGGSGGVSAGGATGGRTPDVAANSEGQTNYAGVLKGMSMSSDGGGGGGGSSGASLGGEDSSDGSPSRPGFGKRGPANAAHGMQPMSVTDVARSEKNVFAISSEVILKHCLDGRLLHCGPK